MVVGTWIGIRHLAAVPLGQRVRAKSTLREINGRKLVFDVVAYDPHEKIAEGGMICLSFWRTNSSIG